MKTLTSWGKTHIPVVLLQLSAFASGWRSNILNFNIFQSHGPYSEGLLFATALHKLYKVSAGWETCRRGIVLILYHCDVASSHILLVTLSKLQEVIHPSRNLALLLTSVSSFSKCCLLAPKIAAVTPVVPEHSHFTVTHPGAGFSSSSLCYKHASSALPSKNCH